MSGTSPPTGSGKRGKGRYQQLYESGALPLPQSPRKKVQFINLEGKEALMYEDKVAEYNEFINSLAPEQLEDLRAYAIEKGAADDTAAARADAAKVSPTPVIRGEIEDPFVSDSDAPEVNATFKLISPGTATLRVRLSPSRRTRSPPSRQAGERHVAPVGAQARLRSRAQARRARGLLEEAARFEAAGEPQLNATSTPAGKTEDGADELAESDDGDQPARSARVAERGQKRQKK